MTLTQAEMEAKYDAERDGSAWKPIIDLITSDPTNDDDALTPDEEIVLDLILARESVPVPPVPAGYPTDRAMLYKSYGDIFISIDRRDGELLICDNCKIAGDEHAVILSPARALALYRFFWNDGIRELMEYHRKNAA